MIEKLEEHFTFEDEESLFLRIMSLVRKVLSDLRMSFFGPILCFFVLCFLPLRIYSNAPKRIFFGISVNHFSVHPKSPYLCRV